MREDLTGTHGAIAGDAVAGQNERLVMRMRRHYSQMAPHAKERETAKLLKEAIEQIDSLGVAIDELPTCKIACNGVLLVTADRYNAAVNIVNT